MCVAAWFDELEPHEYALNRSVDRTLAALSFEDLRDLFVTAGLSRASRLVTIAKDTVKEAKARWAEVLRDAPDNLRASVSMRLAGAVKLAG